MEIKMSNTDALQERESTFRFERMEGNYSMRFEKPVINNDADEDNTVSALMYKLNGSGNVVQRINIFAFRRNVKFVEDNKENNDVIKKINKKMQELIKKHGSELAYDHLKPVYDLIYGLEYINPFTQVEGKEGAVNVPDEIEVKALHPKLNVGLFDAPSNKTKLRYTTRAYKANSYTRSDNGFIIDKDGESLSFMSRELAKDELYDDIIELYDVAEIDPDAAKDPRNVVFNNAICVVK
jgi:hypothetical protein